MLVMIHVQTHTVITCYNRVIMACSVFYSSYNSVPYCFVCSSIQDALKLIYKVTPVFSSEPRGHIFFFWLSVCQTFTWSGMEFVVSGLMTKHLNVILLLMCEREVAPMLPTSQCYWRPCAFVYLKRLINSRDAYLVNWLCSWTHSFSGTCSSMLFRL